MAFTMTTFALSAPKTLAAAPTVRAAAAPEAARPSALAARSATAARSTKLMSSRRAVVGHTAAKRMQVRAASSPDMGGTDDGNVTILGSSEQWEECLAAAGDKLVVLDISTKTCGPCKMVYPHFVQLSKDNEDIVFLKLFGEVTQDTRDLMKSWGVRQVPQFHFWRNKEKVDELVGSDPKKLAAKVAEVAGK